MTNPFEYWLSFKPTFKHVGNLVLRNGRLHYDSHGNAGCVPSVYVICIEDIDGKTEEINYVGMATNGWKGRRGNHNGGMNRVNVALRETKAQTRAAEVYEYRLQCLSDQKIIRVYEKQAKSMEIYGKPVFIHHAEERALIEVLQPTVNWPKA